MEMGHSTRFEQQNWTIYTTMNTTPYRMDNGRLPELISNYNRMTRDQLEDHKKMGEQLNM